MYSIKEITELTGFSLSTLRYYEQLGLLKDVPRNSSGVRYYTDTHRNRLESIACLKSMGMKMRNIESFYSYEENVSQYSEELLELLNKQREIIERQIVIQQQNLEHVDKKIEYFSKVNEAVKLGQKIPKWQG